MISAARLSGRGTVEQPDRPFRRGSLSRGSLSRGSLSVIRARFTARALPCQCIYADRGKVTGETAPPSTQDWEVEAIVEALSTHERRRPRAASGPAARI